MNAVLSFRDLLLPSALLLEGWLSKRQAGVQFAVTLTCVSVCPTEMSKRVVSPWAQHCQPLLRGVKLGWGASLELQEEGPK